MRQFPLAALLMAAAAVCTLPGCLGRGVYPCSDSRQCEPGGHCEATGACSYPETTNACSSGWRYSTHAPDALAGACVQDACPTNPVVRVRAGGAHACEVRGQSGAVSCWGDGTDGQLGDGTTSSRSKPAAIAVDKLGAARDVALGGRHTCALLVVGGEVWCWGANDSGQLGDGTRVSRAQPAPVRQATGEPLGSVVQLAAGAAFTCAVRDNGQVVCWGGNAHGELGQGAGGVLPTVNESLAPLPVPFDGQFLKLSARDRHVCGVAANHTVWCWGANEQGELGDGSQTSRPQPTLVRLPEAIIDEIAVGAAHSCALGGGMLWCWGTNQLGELGDGTNQNQLLPVAVTLAGAADLAAAGHHTCARQSNGTAWCWGANQAGQLGEGTTSNFNVPVPVTAMEDAAEVTAGDTFSCARRRNGTVWCWGDDRLGQLGTGASIDRSSPAPVGEPGLEQVTSISAGAAHTCAVRQNAPRAVCWGDNQAGQLGDGTRLDRSSPMALKLGLDAVQMVAGALHSCLRDTSGGVWCWGRGGSGQLGTSGLIDLVLPTSVPGLTSATFLAAGRAHSCAILKDHSVRCWGANAEGQLGDGGYENRPTPVEVFGLQNVVELALGGAHTCARLQDGTVSCWGRGVEGQLGYGGDASSARPVTIQTLTGATAITAGGSHSCAIVADQSVRCWGAGARGQLGWGTLSGHAVPSKVMNVTGAVRIAAGEAHTCARTSPDGQPETPGSVLCWGDNRRGQLGDGTSDSQPRLSPMIDALAVNGDAEEIAAGGAHSCATRRDRAGNHTIVCWGADDAGQLGDAIVLQYPTAQLTRSPCP